MRDYGLIIKDKIMGSIPTQMEKYIMGHTKMDRDMGMECFIIKLGIGMKDSGRTELFMDMEFIIIIKVKYLLGIIIMVKEVEREDISIKME